MWTLNRLVEGGVSNIWDELNVLWCASYREWKKWDIFAPWTGCMTKKVVLKSFEEHGLLGFCTKFQLLLCQSCHACFLSITTTFLTNIWRKYFSLNFQNFFNYQKQIHSGFDQTWAKSGPSPFVISEILGAMDRPIGHCIYEYWFQKFCLWIYC